MRRATIVLPRIGGQLRLRFCWHSNADRAVARILTLALRSPRNARFRTRIEVADRGHQLENASCSFDALDDLRECT